MLALLGGTGLWALYRGEIDRTVAGEASAATAAIEAFLFGPLGATIAGRWLLMALVFHHAFPARQRWSFHATSISLCLWFTIDSAVSIAHGAWFNVWLVNIWPLLFVGVPLVAIRPAFSASDDRAR